MTVHTGSCRCGKVGISVTGAPMLTMACHCSGCQRMTASAFSLSSLYHQDAVIEAPDLEDVFVDLTRG